jgi:hypothetical protein
MKGELERLAILETEVVNMEKITDGLISKLEELNTAQVSGFNQINLHLSDLNNKIIQWEKRWNWFSRLTLSILAAIIGGVLMLWIKGMQ